MRIKATTVYAVRILGFMMRRPGVTTVSELVRGVGITRQYCMKILNELRHAGLVVSEQGCKGGFRLAAEDGIITLYDVVALFEPEKQSEKGWKAAEGDLFHSHLLKIWEESVERLKGLKLKEIYAGCSAEKTL